MNKNVTMVYLHSEYWTSKKLGKLKDNIWIFILAIAILTFLTIVVLAILRDLDVIKGQIETGDLLGYVGTLATVFAALVFVSFENSKEKKDKVDIKKDIVVKVIGLIPEEKSATSKHKIGGILLSLSKFGDFSLALSLLRDLWKEELIPITIADEIIYQAIEKGKKRDQDLAATILLENGEKIYQEGINIWPGRDNYQWKFEISNGAHTNLGLAVVKWLKHDIQSNFHHSAAPAAIPILRNAFNEEIEGGHQLKEIAYWTIHLFVLKIKSKYRKDDCESIFSNKVGSYSIAESDTILKSYTDNFLETNRDKRPEKTRLYTKIDTWLEEAFESLGENTNTEHENHGRLLTHSDH